MIYASKIGVQDLKVSSNGTLINNSHISLLSSLKIKLIIPLYSYTEVSHDKITRIKGSFRKTIRNLERLLKKEISVGVIIYSFLGNQNKFEKTVELLKSLGCKDYICKLVYPTNYQIERSKHYGNDFISKYNIRKKKFSRINKNDFHKNKISNFCLDEKVAVTRDGNIIPCQTAREHIFGNVNSISFTDCLRAGNLDLYWLLTKDKIEGCKECEFRYGCKDCLIIEHHFENGKFKKNKFCAYSAYEGSWHN